MWAGEEILAVGYWLRRADPALPILLLGSYRDDERPDLPDLLPGIPILKLSRLSDNSIFELTESILGEVGRRTGVLELVKRESEGNVFFLVEALRALAIEVGQLDRIASITLPGNVFAGGIKRLVEQRLKRVPVRDLELLRLAAIIGRQIDTAGL